MKKILLFAAIACIGVLSADGAVRTQNSIQRTSAPASATTPTQTTTSRGGTKKATTKQTTTVSRATNNIVSRTSKTTTPRATSKPAVTSRVATTVARTATPTARRATTSNVVSKPAGVARSARAAISRAATTQAGGTNTFGTGYNVCRDAYFTCMDQFCGTQNETYRRCVCSSKLTEIQSRESALKQTATQLQDFKDLNIAVIPKTSNEVKAMLTASEGEAIAAASKDKSDSAQQLAGISAVLSNSKSKSLSTMGTLDIAGDINEIWATTDLASGVNIANLYGEALYNAVHAQCTNLIMDRCDSTATLNMVITAYGMYIENDCSLLINALDKQLNSANGSIRETEREMNTARLDNYNAHNSTPINDCIAQVRKDITNDNACGSDYVHCLDVTGRYLTYATGTPIYSPEFYQLEAQISLSGDVLSNPTNRIIVNELNRKREFAKRGLETCRDIADEVWDAFMRQALAEIYQIQQEKVRQVKTECLDVVNQCYDTQSQSLKDFSNVKDQLLIGQRLELSEEMCREKLYACANLYGEGGTGMQLLLAAMHDITDQKIANNCQLALHEYAEEMCAVPGNDTLHDYPFGCRVYIPGSQQYSRIGSCNQNIWATEQENLVYPEPEVIKPESDENQDDGTGDDGEDGDGDGGDSGDSGDDGSGGEESTPCVPYSAPNVPSEPTPSEHGDWGAGECQDSTTTTTPTSGYMCPAVKQYTQCSTGYYMWFDATGDGTGEFYPTPAAGNACKCCPTGAKCDGGITAPRYVDCPAGTLMSQDGTTYNPNPVAGNQCITCPTASDGTLTCNGGIQDATYTSCASGYYMTYNGVYWGTPHSGNKCTTCPEGATCNGNTDAPIYTTCPSGTYMTNKNCEFISAPEQNNKCASCPSGATCDGTSAPTFNNCPKGSYMVYDGTYNGTPQPGNACIACPTSPAEGTIVCDGGTANYRFKSCAKGYYMTPDDQPGNSCAACPDGKVCPGGTAQPKDPDPEAPEPEQWGWTDTDVDNECGDYPGSLYQKLVRYAIQTCVRPSEPADKGENYVLPTTVQEDVNVVMDTIRADMGKSLARECERLGGTWVATQWVDKKVNYPETAEDSGDESEPAAQEVDPDVADGYHDYTDHVLHKTFYDETGSNTRWGFCSGTPPEPIILEEEDSSGGGTSDDGTGGGGTGDDGGTT